MTKKSISRLLQASLMCCLAVLFTACDDIFASEDNPIPAYLSISDKPVTIKVGDTYRRKAISVTTAVVEYSSSKTDVATVDNEGLVIAKAEGTTTITATATGYSSQNGKKIYQPASVSYVVTVVPATVFATSLTLNKTTEVLAKNGDALTITATATPSEATFTWESSDEAVATVADGVVTPKGAGIATITAKSGDVKATCEVFVGNEVDLGTKTDDYTVQNYDILKGTLNSSYAISIPNDIKVVFNGVQTTEQIICSGDATIILADGSTNTVTAVSTDGNAGIKIGGTGTTLTINGETAGTGQLTAQGGYYAAGIGTNYAYSSAMTGGYIVINGGTVTATGGNYGVGIGTGRASSSHSNTCGDITINGGTVTATGGKYAAGIGTGMNYSSNTCGNITIGTGVTKVTATKGEDSPNSIGVGYKYGGTQNCGTITFGTAEVFDGTAATGTWTPNPMAAGTYGGLTLAISTTTNANDTWTLTPVAP
jgi:hypothetical protein